MCELNVGKTLLKLKQHWQNPPSLSHWNPLNSSHYCDWPEITCTNGSVTQLLLPNKTITQTVPSFICDLNNLTLINLSYNNIFGEFPRALYNCSKLVDLDLSQNYFNGTIPIDIHRLSRLRRLNLGGNSFSGTIPASIGQLTELRTLQLFSCPFTGSFPPEIGNLSNLERLELAYNVNMTAAVLPSNFMKLKKLTYLWMAGSNLIGEIPDTIGEMEALVHLDLAKNSLSGKIPSTLNIDVIDLSDNKLNGTIPEDFGRLRNMSGTLPPDLGRYSKLQEFQVSSNRLTGNLPEHLCDNGRLIGVVAFDNNLTGKLPESLGNCSYLRIVSVYNNNLSGNIPSGLWKTLDLSILLLSDNSFTGKLPQSVSTKLSRLEMSNNKFSGNIPVGVSSWGNLVVFKASNNLFTGIIPNELTALPRLTTLLLDQNRLSGSLPSDIISWNRLNTLNLSRNEISGLIPKELGSLASLTDLDLSENQLSGQIPPQLGLLKLNSFNLSSNHLTGRIPTQFENNAYARSFLNNTSLCASKPSLNINSCNSEPLKSSNIPPILLALIISLVMAALVGLFASALVIRIRKKRKLGLDSTWELTHFQPINFTESAILSGLTEKNVIGSGGSGKKPEKEFLAEVKILGSIQHSNIVKLLCCISNDVSKLLVYEYSNNHSLDQWLHRKIKASTTSSSVHHVVLDWPKRLQIAIGAAQGLFYMHHGCSPPIVHRDVKSSNILLDSEFNAKIADFGLAKMFKEGELTSMSVVAGSFGYIAPANDGDEHTSLAQWAWRHIQKGNPIVDALDEEVKEPCYLDEMSCVFNLGIICTDTQPSKRPSMKDVVKILLKCNQGLVYGEENATSLCNASPLLKNSKRSTGTRLHGIIRDE
uniref:non-specific serine/threonine protein kinase n=1 Tax=Fagus sylvatica TaxID=28930 RepID=A0A2N9G7P4_FAGSY